MRLCQVFFFLCSVLLLPGCGPESTTSPDHENVVPDTAPVADNDEVASDEEGGYPDGSDDMIPDEQPEGFVDDTVDGLSEGMPDETVDETVEEVPDDTPDETVDEQPDIDQGPQTYPTETPTSNKEGDIAANLTFYDHLGNMRKLEEFYLTKKVLWLAFLAYDCPYSNQLKTDITTVYKSEYINKGFEIILIENGLLSGPQSSKEPAKLAALRDTMLSEYGANADFVYGYLTNTEQMIFYKYINQGYPVSVIIDADTMRIVEHLEGWESSLTVDMEWVVSSNLDE